MDGVHDLGGLHGFGAVPIEADEPMFHEPWEGRVWVMIGSLVRRTTVDRFRYTIEQMPPAEYLGSSYYSRWLWAAERLSEDGQLLAGGGPMAGRPRPSPTTPIGATAFSSGDAVRVRITAGPEHSRVPRYLRGAVGRVERAAFAWPDPSESAASGVYGEPVVFYTVSFAAADLFGPSADHRVTADLGPGDLERP